MDFYFYKVFNLILQSAIFYHRTNSDEYYNKSIQTKNFLLSIGMTEYGKLLEKLLIKYK